MTAKPPEDTGLTRESLLSGELAAMLRKNYPDIHVLTDAEREASLHDILATRPETGDGAWVFAYGSLIWNPLIEIAERRRVRALGWHRDFCLSVKMGRGTPEKPGVMLGLRAGRDCHGVGLRIAEHLLLQELDILWRREMVADGYIPRWVAIETEDGAPLGHAIAFTINPVGPSYIELSEEEMIYRLLTGRGRLGTAAEYLIRTHDGLAELGIIDPFLERLVARVTDELSEAG
jgi:cation transport protein ChaC